MTFSDLARQTELHLRSYRGASPRTCEAYGATFERFKEHLVSTGLGDDVRYFTPEVCQAYAEARINAGLSPNSVCKVDLPALTAAGRLAVQRGYLATNPTDRSRLERPRRKKIQREWLRPAELRSFVQAPADSRQAGVRDLLLATWLRASELCRLNVGDVFEDAAGRVCLWASIKGQQAERRAIPLPPSVGAAILVNVRSRRAAVGDPLLVNAYGQRFSRQALSKLLANLGRRAGITRLATRAHSFRHTLNTLARTSGLDVVQRAALLNHSDLRTIQQYDHILPEETAAARDAVWQAVQEATA